MTPAPRQVFSLFTTMIVTGIVLAPLALATPAVQDLTDLRTVINTAADSIGNLNNPNRGWGFGLGASGQMGTADMVNNITMTILKNKFQLDTNKTSWLLPPLNPTNTTSRFPSPPPPTLPLTSSLALPTTLPTSPPTLSTTVLSPPYIDYVSSIPNLSTSLTSLGRAWHRELNSPVHTAIAALQESISTLQTALLQSGLIDSSAVIRTIRASSSLESAQEAWGRSLNLPGRAGKETGEGSEGEGVEAVKRDGKKGREGKFYTHGELWGRAFVA